jgi:hypothetical protein
MLFSKKTAALCLAVSLLIAYQINRIPAPEKFENPLLLKTFTFIFGIATSLVSSVFYANRRKRISKNASSGSCSVLKHFIIQNNLTLTLSSYFNKI